MENDILYQIKTYCYVTNTTSIIGETCICTSFENVEKMYDITRRKHESLVIDNTQIKQTITIVPK